MKKLFLCFFFCISLVSAQEIYVVNNENDIKIINVDDLSVTDLFTIPIVDAGFITDLAFAPDGKLYGVTNVWTIIEIDLVNETFIPVAELPTGDAYTSLICNSDNELFTSRYLSQQLYSYNLDTDETTFVAEDISSPGDYTYYKGNLVYPGFLNDFIKAYDGTEIRNIGCSVPLLWTFVNQFVDCDNNTIYAFDQFAKLYRYDLETADYEFIEDFVAQTGQLYGGATRTEYMASACPTQTLETVSCSLSIETFNPYGISLLQNPVSNLIRLEVRQPVALNFRLSNLEGKVLSQGQITNDQIEVQMLTSGIYFLEVMDMNSLSVFQKRVLKE